MFEGGERCRRSRTVVGVVLSGGGNGVVVGELLQAVSMDSEAYRE